MRSSDFLTEAGEQPTYYFAYGMLTDPKLMQGRKLVGVAELPNFSYEMFAYANVFPTPGRSVYGCLWELTRQDIAELDRVEGYPYLYDRKTVPVKCDGRRFEAAIYTMTPATRDQLEPTQPSQGYVNRIVRGYKNAGVPMQQLKSALRISGIAKPGRKIDNDPSPWADEA